MKTTFSIIVMSLLCIGIGFSMGWWANPSCFDPLCSEPSVYALGKDIKAKGIHIKSGTQIDLRSCEYANRFTVSLFYEKGEHKNLFIPKNSTSNIDDHDAEQYRATIVKD